MANTFLKSFHSFSKYFKHLKRKNASDYFRALKVLLGRLKYANYGIILQDPVLLQMFVQK